MILTFSNVLPKNISVDPVCISGNRSVHLPHKIYILEKDNETTNYVNAFEICYSYSCSPFKQAEINNEFLAVGFEGYFYLYNLSTKKNIASIELNGYFGNFHFKEDGIYICDACAVWRIGFNGNPKWCNRNLGIDGIIISEFQKDKIIGSGEWNPPGGWESFEIDRESGIELR